MIGTYRKQVGTSGACFFVYWPCVAEAAELKRAGVRHWLFAESDNPPDAADDSAYQEPHSGFILGGIYVEFEVVAGRRKRVVLRGCRRFIGF